MNMKNYVMKKIKNEVENLGGILLINYKFSNTGEARIMKNDEVQLGFHFNFQRDYAKIQIYPKGAKIVGTYGFTHGSCIGDFYIDYNTNLQLHMTLIQEHIKNALPIKKRTRTIKEEIV